MTPPLFLVDRLPTEGTFVLDGDEGRHAARVRRIGLGEDVLIADGLGGLLTCVVAEVVPDGLRLSVRSVSRVPVPRPRLVVVQALPKGDRADLAVEVLTELGVDEIVPWSASRSITRWDGPRGTKALEKWRRTAREAAKQSRRPRLPIVHDLSATPQVAARLGSGLVLHEDATLPLSSVRLPDADEIVLVVGPEGGVSDDELEVFVAAGGTPVKLGDEVMRTSTAGAAALAVLSVRLGRWT